MKDFQYRIKTKKEFEYFYGPHWKNLTCWNKAGEMDYLFGKKINGETDTNEIKVRLELVGNRNVISIGRWCIYTKMILSKQEHRQFKLKNIKKRIHEK